MPKVHKPRSGSLAFYPRKKAKKEIPSLRSFPKKEETGVQAFYGYKAGMMHLMGKDEHKNAPTFGQEIVLPATIIECPALKVFGVRAYTKDSYGLKALTEVKAEKLEKELERRLKGLKRKKKEKKVEKEVKEENKGSWSNLEEKKGEIEFLCLLCHTQPKLTGIGKKKPEIVELRVNGKLDEAMAFAKEKLGKDLKVSDILKEKEFVDVKAVTKGKGWQGVIKRFGVKQHRPKSKHRRRLGSLGPWHPATVHWTVARPGQLGYFSRTEINKKVLMVGGNGKEITPLSGFNGYGVIKNDFVLLSGSVPGPRKRLIAIREHVRIAKEKKHKISEITFFSTKHR
ncbi:MAG: 50S ribosomal protein L3 [archaeon]